MTFALIFLLGSPAVAQQFDLSAGVSGLTAPSSTADLQTIGGGAYPTFGLDFLFFHNLGVGFNAAFRAKENLYQGQLPFRPFFYDVDAVYAPPLGKRAQLEFSAGIGAESVRFYTPQFQCSFTGCTNFVSSNHFLGQFGAAIRLYVTPRILYRLKPIFNKLITIARLTGHPVPALACSTAIRSRTRNSSPELAPGRGPIA